MTVKGPFTRVVWPSAFAALLLALSPAACRRGNSVGRGFGTTPPDVVLITVDTLRYDALGFTGNRRVKTPNLDRLAGEGRWFSQAHAQNVVTLPSHVNILTGLYPFQHGVRDNDGFRLADDVPTLATRLRAAGYRTAAFIGAFPLDARFGLAKGFEVYDQNYPRGAHAYDFVMPERRATEVVAGARNWLDSLASAGEKKPFFLWVHLYDCHAPYAPPPPFDREYSDVPYEGEVAAVDEALGPLFDQLRAKKGSRGTLLVLTADHGEALGDHGEETHGLFAYEATLHIPLILWSPGHVAPGTDQALSRHVDIVPTVLDAARVPIPADLPGVSLLKPRAPEVSYFESLSTTYNRGWAPLRGEIGGGYKYIDLPVPELYELSSDPGESRNLFSPDAPAVRTLRKALPPDSRSERKDPGSEEAARLASLGYIAGSAPAREHYGREDDPKILLPIDQKLHRVVDLYQRKQLSEAMTLAREIVRSRPTMGIGYDFLSFLQSQSGDDRSAMATLADAQKQGVLTRPLANRLALLEASNGRPAQAEALLKPFLDHSDPEVWNSLGIARASGGDLPGALEAFRGALAADPKNGEAYQNMGIALLQADRTREAIAAFEKAFALDDRLPRAWNAYGVALDRSGSASGAIGAWKKAYELDPEQYDALYNIALTAARAGDRATERDALEKFIARAPGRRYAGEIDQARRLLEGVSR
ncbi:MAG: sulfatase-like hydrolase/transferase [Thermoanaerobaculia bacterium]